MTYMISGGMESAGLPTILEEAIEGEDGMVAPERSRTCRTV